MEQDRPEEIQHAEDRNEPEESTGTPAVEETLPELEWSWPAKAGFIFAGVILPVVCFGIVQFEYAPFGMHVDWQSGELSDYCELLFSPESCLPFYPFLLYPMACMTCMVIRPQWFSQSFMARLGIYTGVLLAVQYFILLGFASDGIGSVVGPVAAFVLWGGAWLISWFLFGRVVDGPVINLGRVAIFPFLILICARPAGSSMRDSILT